MIDRGIGGTPIITLSKIVKPNKVFVKLEKNNITGSVKDRAAYFMIRKAEIDGVLNKEKNIIVEPTSGNTGIALAAIGKNKGYRVILTMPESMSVERRKILEKYGAELILTPADKGMKGSIEKAFEIVKERDAFMPNQFENPANILAHELTTGPEILKQMDYNLDIFVAGVGTGGTITGVGKVLKKFFKDKIKIVAVEPENSAVISGKEPGKHKIQGIGAGFIPKNLDVTILDEVITMQDEEAFEMQDILAKKEGLFVGISAAANILAAIKLAQKFPEKKIVTVAPDSGDKYLSLI
ncbi:cysteine synthase [Marinitoga hydrogenitolerans DSM 16785]|uniref:cysteine synthase n=1 Tax=Marinitoga hydrogenitolerans (strain DSM 16785 / JCM 12826 / AT1271) TaxID=1122195 RepID=A0A1M4SEM0_MARH1|nr:cysteine synthase A [Marinitoga hydrogenitolerans]SHE30636.1 cysteine synthase [Marinitoga hydrogenitolerans DSM 16785]